MKFDMGAEGYKLNIGQYVTSEDYGTLLELLRDHVVDWGDCDHPTDCVCSHARAQRFLVDHGVDIDSLGVT